MTAVWHALWSVLGSAGQRLAAMDAAEAAAGNLSIFVPALEPPAEWAERQLFDLPVAAPALSGGWLVVSASGRRLRDIAAAPEHTLCLLQVLPDGRRARLLAATPLRPTSEFNSHLAIHNDQVGRHGLTTHAVAHAQPLHLTWLSHVPRYRDAATLNRRLLRWQPETIIEFPEGIATLPFEVPGSDAQMRATVAALQQHRAVVWQQHGLVTRAPTIDKAVDLIEYAETAARYEYLDLLAGERAAGLSPAALRRICEHVGLAAPVLALLAGAADA
ncbi:class II aldolase/adducin family protein [Kallotenue papyrolyticum]|uniref:class II aldolase/adducin family protein n=1 Tax=Kallotenue papyrolyticum TaxID=1325125 RepID=UPI000478584B|nr:class II aldolase/adducin family protein [Kallotenue papyrolyticum]